VRLKLIQNVINKMASAHDLFERANHGMTPIAEQREMAAVTAFSGEAVLYTVLSASGPDSIFDGTTNKAASHSLETKHNVRSARS
jgi:hypothetical protein